MMRTYVGLFPPPYNKMIGSVTPTLPHMFELHFIKNIFSNCATIALLAINQGMNKYQANYAKMFVEWLTLILSYSCMPSSMT